MIISIVLVDGERDCYNIQVNDDDGYKEYINPYSNNGLYPEGYNNDLSESLWELLKSDDVNESELLIHLREGQRGSLHSFVAYQLLKIPKSIKFEDNRTRSKNATK